MSINDLAEKKKRPEKEDEKELVVLLTNDKYIRCSPWSETSDSLNLIKNSKNCDCNSVLHNSLILEFNMHSVYSFLHL